jgi:hypothetical protein
MGFVWFSKQTQIISTSSNNYTTVQYLIVAMETRYVLFEVGITFKYYYLYQHRAAKG